MPIDSARISLRSVKLHGLNVAAVRRHEIEVAVRIHEGQRPIRVALLAMKRRAPPKIKVKEPYYISPLG